MLVIASLLLGGQAGGTTVAAAGAAETRPAAVATTAATPTVTLRHRASGLRIRAPRGFELRARKGVYVLRKGGQTMSFSRSVTPVGADAFGAALLEQLGGVVRSRRGSARQFTAEVDRGRERETIVVRRAGEALEVTTGTSPLRRRLSLATVRRVGASARGGFALRPPAAAAAPAEIPLTQYRAPDGGSTALVPAEAGWTFDGGGGTVQGSSDRGAFLFGLSLNVMTPEAAPPGTPPGILVAPYMAAPDAVAQIMPRLSPAVSDIRIRTVLRDGALPGFTSSGMYLVDYRVNGQPWTGMALVATDGPEKYSGYAWNFYYSGFGVPAGSDGSVGAALLKTWQSWNPSGAIAQRASRAKQIMDETAAMWRDVGEFRQRTADRQARDVGCLLQGHYVIEDNSRKYDLPPLPCGRIYLP